MESPRIKFVAQYDAATQATPLRDFSASDWQVNLHEDGAFNGRARALALRRFRWEVRNNPFLAGLYAKFPEAIGVPSLRIRTTDTKYNDRVETLFWRWSKRRCELNGSSLRTVIGIVFAEMLVAGELFVVLLADGRIQLVPSENCGGGESVGAVNGIVRDGDGNAATYYLCPVNANGGGPDYSKARPVKAENVIHVWHRDRAAMGRGIPWLLASLATARDLLEIVRSKTKQVKDANSVSGTIEKVDAASTVRALQGYTGDTPDTTVPPSNAPADKPTLELRPGTFVGLEPGEKLNMLAQTYHADDYERLVMLMLNAVSAPVRFPVELWFSGLGEVNFSGFKGLGTQWAATRRSYADFIEESLLDRLEFWWLSKARNSAIGSTLNPPSGSDDSDMQWAWKNVAVLDEEREAAAAEKRLRSGQSSPADEWERNGEFSDEVLEKRSRLWADAARLSDEPERKPPVEWLLSGVYPVVMPEPSEPSTSPAVKAKTSKAKTSKTNTPDE